MPRVAGGSAVGSPPQLDEMYAIGILCVPSTLRTEYHEHYVHHVPCGTVRSCTSAVAVDTEHHVQRAPCAPGDAGSAVAPALLVVEAEAGATSLPLVVEVVATLLTVEVEAVGSLPLARRQWFILHSWEGAAGLEVPHTPRRQGTNLRL
ncbi:UNVERIFIED_CONTAM: hypothetical protein FKN15_067297 [Acipenser sinensis]